MIANIIAITLCVILAIVGLLLAIVGICEREAETVLLGSICFYSISGVALVMRLLGY